MATVGRKNLQEQVEKPVTVESETTKTETGKTTKVEKDIKDSKVLKAMIPILYNGRMYEPCEKLPTNDVEMIEAWIQAGTAIWDEGE